MSQIPCPACVPAGHPGLGAARDGVCPVCLGAAKLYVPDPNGATASGINWQPVINALTQLIILVITTIGAYYAAQADTKGGAAHVQAEKNGKAVERVEEEQKAMKRFYAPPPKE